MPFQRHNWSTTSYKTGFRSNSESSRSDLATCHPLTNSLLCTQNFCSLCSLMTIFLMTSLYLVVCNQTIWWIIKVLLNIICVENSWRFSLVSECSSNEQCLVFTVLPFWFYKLSLSSKMYSELEGHKTSIIYGIMLPLASISCNYSMPLQLNSLPFYPMPWKSGEYESHQGVHMPSSFHLWVDNKEHPG